MGNHILVFYGTRYGQTAKIARFIADSLTKYGLGAALVDGAYGPRNLPLVDFDGVIRKRSSEFFGETAAVLR